MAQAATTTNTTTPKRKTPTDRQLDKLRELSTEELTRRALAAMHALNRRAKKKRDRRNKFRRATFARSITREIERIYELKTNFLEALVRASLATVESYRFASSRPLWRCEPCDHEWVGYDGECYRCGCEGSALELHETWYVVRCLGYSFHQPKPSAPPTIVDAAVPGAAHDPNQPQRYIPNVGLTVRAQCGCVEMLIARLGAGALQ